MDRRTFISSCAVVGTSLLLKNTLSYASNLSVFFKGADVLNQPMQLEEFDLSDLDWFQPLDSLKCHLEYYNQLGKEIEPYIHDLRAKNEINWGKWLNEKQKIEYLDLDDRKAFEYLMHIIYFSQFSQNFKLPSIDQNELGMIYEKVVDYANHSDQSSYWIWITKNSEGNIDLKSTTDLTFHVEANEQPVLVIDLWEHAYYLENQNDKLNYIRSFFEHLSKKSTRA